MQTRRQASLYLNDAPLIESVRMRFNPAQAKLIPAHVTLIREDEVADWDELHQQLKSVGDIELTLQFGAPKREANLVYLPVVSGTYEFDELRSALLPGTTPRKHNPHLTVIHPRNGICTDAIFEEILDALSAFEATFTTVSLIEQTDGGPWVQFT